MGYRRSSSGQQMAFGLFLCIPFIMWASLRVYSDIDAGRTWDFWEVLTVIAPRLKHEIMKRDGAVVWRPDSGDPVKIVCGDPDAEAGTPEHKGAMELLISTFGYTKNRQGYKQLDPHVGLIYGDSITLERQAAICDGLMKKGICPSVVFGIGSFSYQYNTRDTFGMAMKATYGEVKAADPFDPSGVETLRPRDIFKNPKTGSSSTPKASARGLLAVEYVDGVQTLFQQQTWEQSRRGELVPVFSNGSFYSTETFSNIRKRLHPRW